MYTFGYNGSIGNVNCTIHIPVNPLHNSDTVTVHFNHLRIWDKLSRHLYMLTYIYKGLNSTFLVIMVKANTMWFPEVC